MFRRLLLSSAALSVLASAALAADLPSRRAPPPAYYAVPVFTWSGFYVGGNAGYIFSDQSRVTTTGNNGTLAGPGTLFNTANNIRVNSAGLQPEGFTGGGQIGYNYQFGSIVFGVEADASYTDYKQSGTFGGRPTATGLTAFSTLRTDMSYLGTVRGRLGYAFDRVLVYGTGGFAYGDVTTSALFFQPGTGTGLLGFAGRKSNMETGWTAGGGVEYALPTSFSLFNSNAVTLKAEALYYDLGKQTFGVPGVIPATLGTSYTSRAENSGVIARAGINFKFGTF